MQGREAQSGVLCREPRRDAEVVVSYKGKDWLNRDISKITLEEL
jgi:hypothetical protein